VTEIGFIDNQYSYSYTNITMNNNTFITITTINERSINFIVKKTINHITSTICDETVTTNSRTYSCYIGNRTGTVTIAVKDITQYGEVLILYDIMEFEESIETGTPLLGILFILITIPLILTRVSTITYLFPLILFWFLKITGIMNIHAFAIWGLTFIVLVITYITEVKK
jgi:hypothetical protein